MRFVTLLLAACGACGSSSTGPDLRDASATQVLPADQQLLVGGLAEGTLTGGPGDYARIVITSPGAIAWNIHNHLDNGTDTAHAEQGVTSADYTFAPAAAADWFLTLRNQASTPVTVHVVLSLYAGMAWSGWN